MNTEEDKKKIRDAAAKVTSEYKDTLQKLAGEKVADMPEGWKRLSDVTSTHAQVAVSAKNIHTAMDLMKEMAEALEEVEPAATQGLKIATLYKVSLVLRKWKEWK